MKCKSHPYDLGVGVCASCLRGRLLALIAAQNQSSSEFHRSSLDAPPPLLFPRSVSPYISHRRSIGPGTDYSCHPRPHRRFFSTPQVGPTSNSESILDTNSTFNKKAPTLSLLSSLFRSGSSWISSLIRKNRYKSKSKSKSKSKAYDDDKYGVDDEGDGHVSSGYSTESSTGWRQPEPTPVRHKFSTARQGPGGVSGFAVCLSPLVRPSPKPAAELGIAGDLHGRLSVAGQRRYLRRHVSVGAGSLVPSRSRKLADHGRFK